MYSLFVWFQEFNLRISDSAAASASPPGPPGHHDGIVPRKFAK
jgi:hypothetical protein